MLSVTFSIVLVMGGAGKNMKSNHKHSNDAFAQGATLAEEAITSIRATTAFGAQEKLAGLFGRCLDSSRRFDFRAKAFLGGMIACMMGILNYQYALGFWTGSRFINDGNLSIPQVITVILASMLAGASLGHVAPHLGAFANATAAGQKIFDVIDRQSPLDPSSEAGKSPASVTGEIRFQNIKHVYPSRPDQNIFVDLTLDIPAGKVTAVVGLSGSGKSTLVGLIERFYLSISGTIYLDGYPLQDLNLRWLRSQISLVSQEPVLFDTTVYENIRYGLFGTDFDHVSSEITGFQSKQHL
jgi:ATP-binding cassette, subfamily B (MDR/TAP), member 1